MKCNYLDRLGSLKLDFVSVLEINILNYNTKKLEGEVFLEHLGIAVARKTFIINFINVTKQIL